MNSGINPNAGNDNRSPELEIYLHARNTNLLWRYEILDHNGFDPTAFINKMEDDIFWDLAEIERESAITRSLRLTNLGLSTLPESLSIPFNAKILDLSNNKLSSIPENWFSTMDNLEILRLANNKFESLPWKSVSQLTNLKILDLRGNPLNDEYLEKFKSYVKMFKPDIRKIYI